MFKTRFFALICLFIFSACSSEKALAPARVSPTSSGNTGGSSPVPTTAPSAPSLVSAASTTSFSAVVSWSDNSTDETGFYIYMSTTSTGTYALVGTNATNISTYTATGLSPNTTYYFKVTAFNAVGASAVVGPASVTTLVSAAPSNLKAYGSSSTNISLQWQDNSTTETAFTIERSFADNGAPVWVTVAIVPADTIRYQDHSLAPGSTYYYRVTATGVLPTAISNTAFGTTFSGGWDSVNSSATTTGLSGTTNDASEPSVAVDSSGRIVTVWEQNVEGVDSIYLKIYDPAALDTSTGFNVGWKPAMVNQVVTATTFEDPLDNTTKITGISTSRKQTSIQGKGISMANGDAQRPRISYDSTRDQFIIVWQEMRSGRYEIMGRRMTNISWSGETFNDFFQVTFSNSTVQDETTTSLSNPTADDGILTVASTWNLSGTASADSIRPEIASIGGTLFAVWEEYVVATPRTWQVYGSSSTITATAAYPAVPTVPVVADIDAVGASSRAGNGISQAATTRHARSPSIAVADATHIYVAWQSTDPVNGDSDISTNFCDGNNFSGAAVVVANTGSSQNPRLALDATAAAPVPYLAWEDNTFNSTYNIYALQGNTAGTVWSNLTASGIISGDTTDGGISDNPGGSVAQNPSVAVDGTTFYVTWQDTSIGVSNIYVKRYYAEDGVSGEDASWVGMGGSDESAGISSAAFGARLPTIRVASGSVIYNVWEDVQGSAGGIHQIYLKRW